MNIVRGTYPFLLVAFLTTGAAQTSPPAFQQLAKLIDVDGLLNECATLQCNHPDSQNPGVRQLFIRQQIEEAVVAASLDVDSVLAEIANEHARLVELRSTLEARRDRAANYVSAGNLVLGTGVGILVNALQFKNSTAIAGDVIGVGSGAASVVLSVVGIHLQNGPQHAVGRSPNMLAAVFERPPVLHSDYPKTVLAYLNSSPEAEPTASGTRIEQLRREWQKAGRLGRRDSPRVEKKIDSLTSSLDSGPRSR